MRADPVTVPVNSVLGHLNVRRPSTELTGTVIQTDSLISIFGLVQNKGCLAIRNISSWLTWK